MSEIPEFELFIVLSHTVRVYFAFKHFLMNCCVLALSCLGLDSERPMVSGPKCKQQVLYIYSIFTIRTDWSSTMYSRHCLLLSCDAPINIKEVIRFWLVGSYSTISLVFKKVIVGLVVDSHCTSYLQTVHKLCNWAVYTWHPVL